MKTIGLVAVAFALSGCAAGLDGFYQKVQFDSAPAGASVNLAWLDRGQPVPLRIDGSCTTPCALPVARDRIYRATFTKEGCGPVEARLYPTYETWYSWLPPSLLPDAWTGKTYDLTPDPLTATLPCGAGA